MLKNLIIKNYALLQSLEMEPSSSLNIITGETGAGKSIMLGAVGLLLGNRADKKSLYNEDQKCVIEGSFTVNKYQLESIFDQEELDYDPVCILRREITPSGKSRAFINDTPVRLDTMRSLGRFLVDIHSQHDSLLLGNQEYQLEIIDAYADNEKLLKTFQQAYHKYRRANSDFERLKNDAFQLKKESDYHQFLLDELHKAALKEGEQDQLEGELQVMENAGNIREQLSTLITVLTNETHGVDDMLVQGKQALSKISSFSKKYDTLFERLESCLIELRDISSEAETEALEVEFDMERVEAVRERINLINQLQSKHQVNDVDGLLSIQDELERKLEKILNLDDDIAHLIEVKDAAYNEMTLCANALSQSRKKIFVNFAHEISELLKNLGIPDASLEVDLQKIEPGHRGIDEVNILFSANKGIAPQEIKGVASGGEFSRLMFCIKYVLADKISLPTIIFDEIDTGVSGEIAINMVSMMREMAKSHQVIAISHLPQVAAKGNAHYFVYKDNSSDKAISKIKKLNEHERIEQIAKMIGGNNPSTIAFENAKELLA